MFEVVENLIITTKSVKKHQAFQIQFFAERKRLILQITNYYG